MPTFRLKTLQFSLEKKKKPISVSLKEIAEYIEKMYKEEEEKDR